MQELRYIEAKTDTLNGEARIGYVTFSKTGKTIYYGGRAFRSLKGRGGSKANYYDVATGEEYWISGCRKDGEDRLYESNLPVAIDEDARGVYWESVRELPDGGAQSW